MLIDYFSYVVAEYFTLRSYEWAAVLKRRWILSALHLTVEVENIIIYLNYFWGKDICIMAGHSAGGPMNQKNA